MQYKLFTVVSDFQNLAYSLQDFLDYEGDIVEAFMQPFCVGSKDVFGNSHTHLLKENGDQIIVSNETRKVAMRFNTRFSFLIALLCTVYEDLKVSSVHQASANEEICKCARWI